MTERIAEIYRKTNETEIRIHLNLDGTGQGTIQTGIGFLIICCMDLPDTVFLI